jgi:hypothetical protein
MMGRLICSLWTNRRQDLAECAIYQQQYESVSVPCPHFDKGRRGMIAETGLTDAWPVPLVALQDKRGKQLSGLPAHL